jgi:F-type H+-transporting ATPase subunit a
MVIGPFDLSITKAVIYLWLALAICCGFTVYVARRIRPRPDRKQSFVEALYEFTSNGIAGETLPENVKGKPFRSKYFPYIASLFVLIWTVNFISFIPLPLNTEHTMNVFGVEIPSFALYASTSNLNVTLALTILTLVIAHYEGVKNNGGIGYLKSFAAGDTLGIKLFTWPLHLIGEFAKVISLSVRLFANMLGGHLLILVMLSLAGFIGSMIVMGAGLPLAVAFFLFEVGIVVTVQAFIFAILSGVYIGGAAEPHH